MSDDLFTRPDDPLTRALADVMKVASDADKAGVKKDIRTLISILKANFTMQLGETLAGTITNHVMMRPEVGKLLTNGSGIVVKTARCFELICESEWLDDL